MTRRWVSLATVCLTLAFPAAAQQRPEEDALFGSAPDAGAAPGTAPATPDSRTVAPEEPTQPNPSSRDEDRLGGHAATNAFELGSVKEDPLKIGGQFYLRGFAQATEHTPASQTRLSLPTLLDVFLDARPTERLRVMVLGRLSYDPFLNTSIAGLPASTNPPANPSVALDQAWLTFDIEHRVFVTAGRQHVKWGTGHFFNPTDFLSSRRRDPLAQFDTRLGVTMVRANVPFQTSGWNVTGVALFEPTQAAGGLGIGGSSGSTGIADTSTSQNTGTAGTTLGSVGGAARAEFQLGEAAFGLDGLLQNGRKSRLGADVSAPLGPLDVYGEALLSAGSDVPRYQKLATVPPGTPTLRQYQTLDVSAAKVSATVGGSYTFPFHENKSITVGAEYFYNGLGYSDAHIYPVLIFKGVYQPFYTGEHYLAVNATFTDPSAKSSYILSNLGNLTDQSYLMRFDYLVTVLSYLQVEAFADYHYGSRGGEFRFAFDSTSLNDPTLPQVKLQAPLFDVGLGLRMAL